jgi:biotin carboxylase
MRTLLVLGASEGQLPVYREARRLGLRTIGVDRNPAAIAASEADEFLCVSTRDAEAVRRAVGRRPIAGVTSPASDASAFAVRSLSLAYGTPFCASEAAAHASVDKAAFRRVIDALKLPRYGWVAGADVGDLCARARALRFPVAVKPGHSSGSKGITVVSDFSGVADAVALAREFGGREVIIEEFIDGRHYSAECLIADHRPVFMAVIERTITAPPHAITLEQLMPAALGDDTVARLHDAVARICGALDLERGPLNLDLVISPSGAVHMVEMGARAGGNGISRLVRMTYGVNLSEAAIRVAVGEPIDVQARPQRAGLLRILEAPGHGVVTAIRGVDAVGAMPETVELELFADIGTPVHPYTAAGHKIGYLAMAGATAVEARAALDRALAVLQIEIARSAHP